ncbi:MAG TPA: phosphoribosylanthranilate isomerase [Fimbriimonadales bacterium]|nr:phosphoribosylanthranilate isomerase [Fimbriimonadales bacterium]
MTRVKICGLTRREDVECALEVGAHALGFVFEETSPRYVFRYVTNIEELVPRVPFVTRVAVFGKLPKPLPDFLFSPLFDAIQFVEGELTGWNRMVFRVVRIDKDQVLNQDSLIAPDALVLDTYAPDQFGGTGKQMDWEVAKEFVRKTKLPVVLAGGLTPENVRAAVEKVRPFGVDVSSGVEDLPGVKNPVKISTFIENVRMVDMGVSGA